MAPAVNEQLPSLVLMSIIRIGALIDTFLARGPFHGNHIRTDFLLSAIMDLLTGSANPPGKMSAGRTAKTRFHVAKTRNVRLHDQTPQR